MIWIAIYLVIGLSMAITAELATSGEAKANPLLFHMACFVVGVLWPLIIVLVFVTDEFGDATPGDEYP